MKKKQRYIRRELISFALAVICGLGPGSRAAYTGVDEQSVLLTLPDKAAVDRLSQQGFLVETVTPVHNGVQAVINTTAAERTQLLALGYVVVIPAQEPTDEKAAGYWDYASLTTELNALATAHPSIARLESLGQSVGGRELWAMRITDNPDAEEDEPEFKYVATIHGDEPVGTELCMHFIRLLLDGYNVDTDLTDLVDETEIWVVPLMNPDGLEANTRRNADGFDLNRSFPNYGDDFTGTLFSGEALHLEQRPPEVQHVVNWSVAQSFVLSANLHTGALVVNYPYDFDGLPSGVNAPSPDDALFRELSYAYADLNPPMSRSSQFPGGITNGCDWYSITGGMQDWNYRYLACMEVTIELSNIKRPNATTLDTLWEQNRDAMLAYLQGVHWGVRGIVRDRSTAQAVWAEIQVDDNPQKVFTDPDVGDYHRILLPGSYTLTIRAPGYIPYRVAAVIVPPAASVRRDVALSTGDVNGDQMVDAADVQYLVTAILDGAEDPMADVDGRGLSATDLQAVINRALRR